MGEEQWPRGLRRSTINYLGVRGGEVSGMYARRKIRCQQGGGGGHVQVFRTCRGLLHLKAGSADIASFARVGL